MRINHVINWRIVTWRALRPGSTYGQQPSDQQPGTRRPAATAAVEVGHDKQDINDLIYCSSCAPSSVCVAINCRHATQI